MTQHTKVAGTADGPGLETSHPKFFGLMLGCIGVVYGDIGTSPLYALRESVLAAVGPTAQAGEEVILGILSLIIWALILIVTVKYVMILLRADNNGEGGTLALMALARRALGGNGFTIMLLGMMSAALFYGDAMITPALSVLSAVEGLEVITPALARFVVPLSVAILFALFAVQSRGTARVATFFGPITLLWFFALAVGGAWHVAQNPSVLAAFNPVHGVSFLLSHGIIGLLTLGAVFLVVTGAEALYADLGHFGRGPIRMAWLTVCLPALTINYLGQGALLLGDSRAIANPFFLLYPDWARVPMIALATAATVIASQAVISGAYSLTAQAIQLGLLPRLEIRHTSESQFGQIYIPRVNIILLIGVLLLVVQFRSSGALASAYGIAVTGTMVVTAIMAFIVIWKYWQWPVLGAAALMAPFLLIDLIFLGANLLKVFQGGWVPLMIGAMMMTLMLTWVKGARILATKTRRLETPIDDLIDALEKRQPHKVAGTAVFLTADPEAAPTALLHSLKHYKVLHDHNVVLTLIIESTPRVSPAERVSVAPLGKIFTRVLVRFGFMETPNIPKALALARRQGLTFDIMSTSFFLSRRVVRQDTKSSMRVWQDRLFIILAKNADDASSYFGLPTDRVVEIGTQITV
ncbi:MAG TPA: potassium transporter Kup [Methyloceanibacter sp.]|nr:potassium transporter Kup [Methyloceanibacter sp.]